MESIFRSIINLFSPPVCQACGKPLPKGVEFLCPHCRWELPLTETWRERDNIIAQKFWGLVPIETACSLFYYRSGSLFRGSVHDLKYHGYWKISVEFGNMLGQKLLESDHYGSIDYIVPIPLHPLRRIKRGYNQSEYIAKGISEVMNIPIKSGNLIRKRHNRAQARSMPRHLRWHNVRDIFDLRDPSELAGAHILLVDDVLTTGATITSAIELILKRAPDCRISVATLAVSEYELNKNPQGRRGRMGSEEQVKGI